MVSERTGVNDCESKRTEGSDRGGQSHRSHDPPPAIGSNLPFLHWKRMGDKEDQPHGKDRLQESGRQASHDGMSETAQPLDERIESEATAYDAAKRKKAQEITRQFLPSYETEYGCRLAVAEQRAAPDCQSGNCDTCNFVKAAVAA